MNRVIISGNIGNDPEIRHTQDGKAISSFSLATSEKWKDKSTGERKEKTEWHRVVCFNDNLTKVIEQYVKKGSKLLVEGTIQYRKYTDKDGMEKNMTEIVISAFDGKIELLGERQGGDAQQSSSRASSKPAPSLPRDLDDEVPF